MHYYEIGRPRYTVSPNPKGFRMHNRLYKKGSLEEKNMWWRYTRLRNNPRWPEERRLLSKVYGRSEGTL